MTYILRHRKLRFSPVYYELHKERLCANLFNQLGCLATIAILMIFACTPLLFGCDSVLAASFVSAAFIFTLTTSVLGTLDLFKVRLLPFFEQPLNDIDTWLAGKDLLWNSLALDEIADKLGVTPLCQFASGDPLIQGETSTFYDASDALATTEALLQSNDLATLNGHVVNDLTKLRDALKIATKRGVRFSMHLREGSTASGDEMDRRQGSYF